MLQPYISTFGHTRACSLPDLVSIHLQRVYPLYPFHPPPTSGYLSKDYENSNLKRYMHPHVYHNIICNNQDMETT